MTFKDPFDPHQKSSTEVADDIDKTEEAIEILQTKIVDNPLASEQERADARRKIETFKQGIEVMKKFQQTKLN